MMAAVLRYRLQAHRCLMRISGCFEWKTTPDGKQPYYFSQVDGAPITVAGLWDEWKDIDTGEPLKSCTMITTANELTSDTHDRMPVTLEAGAFAPWLSGGADTELPQPAANDVLQNGLSPSG